MSSAEEITHTSTQFRFGGHQMCIKTLCFLHNMNEKRIKVSWKENGLRPCDGAHSSPYNRTKPSDVEQVVWFVLRHTEDIMQFSYLVTFLGTNKTIYNSCHHQPPNVVCGSSTIKLCLEMMTICSTSLLPGWSVRSATTTWGNCTCK